MFLSHLPIFPGVSEPPGVPPAPRKPRPNGCHPGTPSSKARRIEEQQRQQAERAPHRWSQGLKVSVPVDRLETKAGARGGAMGLGGGWGVGGLG
jgi:hypothetical protein